MANFFEASNLAADNIYSSGLVLAMTLSSTNVTFNITVTAPQYNLTNGATITDPGTGAIALTASGTNQIVQFAPSGTGKVKVLGATGGGGNRLDFYNGATLLAAMGTDAQITAGGLTDFNIYGGGSSNILISPNGGLAVKFAASGNSLFGTPTDSSNGRLQLATHTTSAGGIGFGTDTTLYRTGTGTIQTQNMTASESFSVPSTSSNLSLTRLYIDSPSGQTAGVAKFLNNGTAFFTALPTGIILFGTTTDNSNGRLQLATHTTSAGGIGFGTDATLYRSAAGQLTFGATTASTSTTTGSLVVGSNVGLSGNAGGPSYFGGSLQAASFVSSLGSAGTSFFTAQLFNTASYGNYRILDSSAGRHAELIYIGSGAGAVYGGAAGDAVLNENSGNLIFSTGDIKRVSVATGTGNVAFTSTTDATTGGAGSISTAGGIYAAKQIIAGTGMSVVGGGIGVAGGGNFGGSVNASTFGAGGGPLTNAGLAIQNSNLTSVAQYGVASYATFNSLATTSGTGVYTQFATAAASFTMANGYGLVIAVPSLGAGSVVTTLYGLFIGNQTGGGTNYAIFTNLGLVRFGDTTDATTGGAGSLTTSGGIYAAKQIISGGNNTVSPTTGTNAAFFIASNTGGTTNFGRDNSTGSNFGTAYATALWSTGAYPMLFATNNTLALTLDSSQNATFAKTVTVNGGITYTGILTGQVASPIMRTAASNSVAQFLGTSGTSMVLGLDTQAAAGQVFFRRASAAEGAIASGDNLGLIGWSGAYATSLFSTAAARIQATATETWTSTSGTPTHTGTQLEFGVTQTGATGLSTVGIWTYAGLAVTGTGSFTGNVGIGGAASSTNALDLTSAAISGTSAASVRANATWTPGANSVAGYGVLTGQSTISTGTNTGLVWRSVAIGTPTITGTGTIATVHQLYIAAAPTATSTYGIYQAGTDDNYFAGRMQIGGTNAGCFTYAGGSMTGASSQIFQVGGTINYNANNVNAFGALLGGTTFAAGSYTSLSLTNVGINTPTITGTAANVQNYQLVIYPCNASAGTKWALYQQGASDMNYFAGRIGINATSTLGVSPEYLTIKYDQSTNTGLAIQNTTNGYATNALTVWGHTAGYAGGIQITSATTVSFITSSDVRLKTNIRNYYAGDLIDRIAPRIFDWKTGETDSIGFIAQELYEIFPQAVSVGGEDSHKNPWAVDFSKLMPLAIAEIKALRARVKELESKTL